MVTAEEAVTRSFRSRLRSNWNSDGLFDWVIASLGTDGQDAMTGLAGAIADAGTPRRARQAGVDPVQALARNDSLSVFEVSGGSVETGPTGTNVNDVYIAVRARNRPDGASGRGS